MNKRLRAKQIGPSVTPTSLSVRWPKRLFANSMSCALSESASPDCAISIITLIWSDPACGGRCGAITPDWGSPPLAIFVSLPQLGQFPVLLHRHCDINQQCKGCPMLRLKCATSGNDGSDSTNATTRVIRNLGYRPPLRACSGMVGRKLAITLFRSTATAIANLLQTLGIISPTCLLKIMFDTA